MFAEKSKYSCISVALMKVSHGPGIQLPTPKIGARLGTEECPESSKEGLIKREQILLTRNL